MWEPMAALLRVFGATAAGEGRALVVAAVGGSVPQAICNDIGFAAAEAVAVFGAAAPAAVPRAEPAVEVLERVAPAPGARSLAHPAAEEDAEPSPGTRGFCSAAPGRRSFRRQCHGARTTCFGTRGPSTPPRSAAAPAPGCAGAEISDAAGVALEAQKQFEKQLQDQNGTSLGAISLYFSQDIVPSFSVAQRACFSSSRAAGLLDISFQS